MTREDSTVNLQVLLQEYRTVSEEIRIYVQEMIKCFPYAAVLVALYLGWGIGGDQNQANSIANKIREYMPYGFVLLSVYFLGLAYVRVGLSRYRAHLERTINELAGKRLMGLDSSYLVAVQSTGFLRLGKPWYARVPTPLLFLGFLITAAGLAVFTTERIREETIIVLFLLVGCGLTALYVFFVYPSLVDRARKRSQNE